MKNTEQLLLTRDAICDVLTELMKLDGYTPEELADMSEYSPNMIRQAASGNRAMNTENLILLMRNLVVDRNYRMLNRLVLPTTVHLVVDGRIQANGSADDEVIDGGDALYTFRNGFNTGNIDAARSSIQKLDDVRRRCEAEVNLMAGAR